MPPKFQQALSLHQRGQLAQAEFLYREILARLPDHFDALHMLGVIEVQRKNPEAAVELIDRALRHKPGSAEALSNRGVALRDLKRHEEALASYERALQVKPDSAETLFNRGIVLRDLKRHEEALASHNRALELKPDFAEALFNRGLVLQDLKRHEEALASYERALHLDRNYVDALNNRGNALHELKRYEAALASYERVLQLKPDFAEAFFNRGNALQDLKRHEAALASYDHALQRKPDFADALFNRGVAMWEVQRHEDAAKCFAQLLEMAPDFDYALGNMFYSRLRCCNWTQYAENAGRIVGAIKDGWKIATPLPLLAVSQSPAVQLQCSQTYTSDRHPAAPAPFWTGQRYPHDRIRVAYVSADLRDHAVSYLLAGLFEKHDPKRFETIAISLRPEEKGMTGQRVKAAFGRFIDVSRKSDREVAALMRESEVDIAVDLMGFTSDSRTEIFAHRPAPIQVNYLGFPATMGAEYIDYILADRFVVPEEKRTYYSEKLVYLPDSFQANDDQRKISEAVSTRLEAGLPESGFVFCSFNNTYKINPLVFDVWMRLLRSVPDSVLWLVADSATVKDNLRREAQERGVEPSRLVFAPRLTYADHLARFQLADLFLDTLPFNAGTTASDALWAGVPVLTCVGEAFASRMAGSLLNAVGLPELITCSMEEYEALALKLAGHPPRLSSGQASTPGFAPYARDERERSLPRACRGARDERGMRPVLSVAQRSRRARDERRTGAPTLLAELKARLARNRTTYPLFDTDRFRRHIEAAYITMWERYQRGEPPASFAVRPIQQA